LTFFELKNAPSENLNLPVATPLKTPTPITHRLWATENLGCRSPRDLERYSLCGRGLYNGFADFAREFSDLVWVNRALLFQPSKVVWKLQSCELRKPVS